MFSSAAGDLLGSVSRSNNTFSVPHPNFDADYRVRDRAYEGADYRSTRTSP